MTIPTGPGAPGGDTPVDVLAESRERTLALVASISDEDLERVHSTLMSPLVWDLGHIAAFEDLWLVHRQGGRPLLRPDLADVYDAFETPRAERGDLPFLRRAQALEYLESVRARTCEMLRDDGGEASMLVELVIRHEQQHNETMLQTIELAALPDYRPAAIRPAPPPAPAPAPASSAHTGLELVPIPEGPCTIGAPGDGFAYDNERPRHRGEVSAFLIGRTPITNAAYRAFVESGGYRRREWWSEEGWTWKAEHEVDRPAGWTADGTARWCLHRLEPLVPDEPVVHVSWYEADAFARAHGARLPTEVEWEKAAAWDEATASARPYPWGEDEPVPGVHANLDHGGRRPHPVGAHPRGASPYGCLAMIGDVWEWTASAFTAYPGFRAYPYREYSEVFFGPTYRVLRGGSWATRRRVATATFRNWDFPERRQIFAGLRIARDV